MPPVKFQLNPTYGLGGDVFWRISRWLPWWPSWISEQTYFSNSESLCRSKASHQVSAQFDLWFGRRCPLKNFKMAAISWISEWNNFSNSESLPTIKPSIKFWLNPTYGLGVDIIWRISEWPPWRPSWISEWNDFSNSESPCCHNASH